MAEKFHQKNGGRGGFELLNIEIEGKKVLFSF